MVKWLQENVPETHTTHIGEPSGRMSEGDRVGCIRTFTCCAGSPCASSAAAPRRSPDATEQDLQGETDRFYDAQPALTTRFLHLVEPLRLRRRVRSAAAAGSR